ncbi:MAG: ROK family transcriptional regulator [Anaerolineae bacterium]|nr:ROK family transcriptional regulator [Anaerolineae bacterium]MCB9107352.1 ROK family transcriptional regulator [Anaerolineales bacterium]
MNHQPSDKPLTGDTRLIRQMNRSAILQLIREQGPISRVDLARLSNLTPATAFSIVEELVELGLVQESGIGDSAGGRKPKLFKFNPNAFAAVGVDLRVDRLIAVVTDLDARPVARIVHTYQGDIDGEEGARLISAAAQEVIRRSGMPFEALVGLGISVPGIIDTENGVVVKAVNLGWEQVPLRELLSEHLTLPTHIVDVSAALAVGETHFGAGQGARNLICINIGSGIGSGIVIGEQLYWGADGVAGEIGHMTVDEDGPQCRCGNYGCLERLAARPAIIERAIKGLKQGAVSSIRSLVDDRLEEVTVQTVVTAANDGDEFARGILNETGRYLGMGIANVVNFLNPEIVIVGGGVTETAGETLLEPLRQTVKMRAFDIHARRVRIVPAQLGIDASAIGDATWAIIKAGLLASSSSVPST